MISLKTNCEECTHKNVCRNKNNAKNDMDRLASMTYGTGSNDDYSWAIMMESRHVDIIFSCHDFMKSGGPILRQ